jgi:cytochrome c oxidase cbb3-type subunit 3
MAIERDPVTGRLTTGHEWNGIKELDTPVPRPVYFFLVVTTLFCIGYWLLMPAWPLGTTFTRGLLGADERAHVTAAVAEAARDRAAWTARFERADFAAIQADPRLMAIMRETGRTLFGDNCAMCHGRDGAGGPGFPSLRRGTPLWGAAPEEIAETLRVGINSTHPESRVAQMPAFGRDGMLKRAEIEAVAAYLRGLADPRHAAAPDAVAGAELFAGNCAACHGADGRGSRETGAPDLADETWIYGDGVQAVFNTIWNGRQGQMPSWEARLALWERRLLALYVADLRAQEPGSAQGSTR